MSNRWRKRQTKPREAATEPPKNKHKRKREIHVKSIRNLLFRRLNLLHCHCLLTRVCVLVLVISLSILEFELWPRRSTSIEVGEIIAN